MVYIRLVFLWLLLTISSLVSAGEKDKYFAKQCFKSMQKLWLLTDENKGTKIDSQYAYWPTKPSTHGLFSGSGYLDIDLEIGIVYGWGEVIKKISDCTLNPAGEVVSTCVSKECFKN